jgi:hypothetical protein
MAGSEEERMTTPLVEYKDTTLFIACWRQGGLHVKAWCLDEAEAKALAHKHHGTVEVRDMRWPFTVPAPEPEGEPPW